MEKSDGEESEEETEESTEEDSESSNQTSTTESSSSESSSVSSNSSSSTSTTGTYKVYLDSPTGVEAYVDGNYVGIVPCSFKKTSGSHVITLRMTGYETRSYTLQLDEEEKDVNYSFNELEKSE